MATILVHHLARENNTVDLPVTHEALIFWMRIFSLAHPDTARNERYFAHRWSWHLNLAWCYGLGRLAAKLLPSPKSAQPIDVFMAARKPG